MATSLCINNGKKMQLILRLKFNLSQFKKLCYFVQVPEKKPCPYMEKCYRRNPIHFNEMSHPHCTYHLLLI